MAKTMENRRQKNVKHKHKRKLTHTQAPTEYASRVIFVVFYTVQF